ncbi:MAG: hypothetical protein NTV50_00790 [Planctomycetota bacterium]|nr:hypothetical protein [Planctomycetota bacterium]
MKRNLPFIINLLLVPLLFIASFANGVHGAEPFEDFLKKHCIACHGPEKNKGDVRIDKFSRDFKLGADTHHWAEVIEQVNSGLMPPKKQPRPTQAEIAAFVTNLDERIRGGTNGCSASCVALSVEQKRISEYRLRLAGCAL